MHAMDISLTALNVEWRRLEVIAENLANANTARTALGTPYRTMRLISGPKISFQRHLKEQGDTNVLEGVEVYSVEPQDLPARKVYEPANPQADAKGYVSYPGFDQAAEMTLMVKTARIYEANAAAMNIARQMYAKALEIGR